MRQMKLKFR